MDAEITMSFASFSVEINLNIMHIYQIGMLEPLQPIWSSSDCK